MFLPGRGGRGTAVILDMVTAVSIVRSLFLAFQCTSHNNYWWCTLCTIFGLKALSILPRLVQLLLQKRSAIIFNFDSVLTVNLCALTPLSTLLSVDMHGVIFLNKSAMSVDSSMYNTMFMYRITQLQLYTSLAAHRSSLRITGCAQL
jgi:hypothetical protein